MTVSAVETVCASAPLVARKVTAALPVFAVVEAEKFTCWLASAATEKGEAGDDVTPGGSPSTEILTEPVKPFWPVTETVTSALIPPR
jgi:hypothetical protein